jgi:DNA-binding transcriptional regulator YiaG
VPSFNTAFKTEVARLARKEIRDLVGATQKATAQQRRDIAALKKEVAGLQRKVDFLESRERKRLESGPRTTGAQNVRFSAKGLKTHRKKLGLSAADYGLLIGVTGQTIYNWESGKGKPSDDKLAAWAAVRGIGVREAEKRLDLLHEE